MNKNILSVIVLVVFLILVGFVAFGKSDSGITLDKEKGESVIVEKESDFPEQVQEEVSGTEKDAEEKVSTVGTDLKSIEEGTVRQEKEYPLHTNITATVFWVGEPVGGGSSEDNAISAWDDEWQKNYGGFDDPKNRNGFYPAGFIPRENPFYLDLPYNDFNNSGQRRADAYKVVPWAGEKDWGVRESMLKNRWVKLVKDGKVCYGQIQDAGPYVYDDADYVFGADDKRPKSKAANNAGMDVSPALRDCLGFKGWNNDENKVNWQFVEFSSVPKGPWKEIITTSQVNWP